MDLQPIVLTQNNFIFKTKKEINSNKFFIPESGSTYEVYVAGVNSAGVGESSTRIVFR